MTRGVNAVTHPKLHQLRSHRDLRGQRPADKYRLTRLLREGTVGPGHLDRTCVPWYHRSAVGDSNREGKAVETRSGAHLQEDNRWFQVRLAQRTWVSLMGAELRLLGARTVQVLASEVTCPSAGFTWP